MWVSYRDVNLLLWVLSSEAEREVNKPNRCDSRESTVELHWSIKIAHCQKYSRLRWLLTLFLPGEGGISPLIVCHVTKSVRNRVKCTSWDFGAIWGQFLEYFLDFFWTIVWMLYTWKPINSASFRIDVTSIWLDVKSEIIFIFFFLVSKTCNSCHSWGLYRWSYKHGYIRRY